MLWTCRKKSGQWNNFWGSYGPLKYVYKCSKMNFSGINPKILIFEYYAKNKTYSEVNFICVYQVWSKLIEKYPSKSKMAATKFSFFTFELQTAVISRASSWSPCYYYYHYYYIVQTSLPWDEYCQYKHNVAMSELQWTTLISFDSCVIVRFIISLVMFRW